MQSNCEEKIRKPRTSKTPPEDRITNKKLCVTIIMQLETLYPTIHPDQQEDN